MDLGSLGYALHNCVTEYGYAALFFGLFLEGTGMPGPVQILFAAAGYFIAQGAMKCEVVVAVATVGNVLGNLAAYLLGLYGGRRLIRRFVGFLGIGLEQLDVMGKRYAAWGAKLVLAGRIFGPVRTPAILSAGLLRVPIGGYLAYSFAGAFVWSVFWTAVGTEFGGRINVADYGAASLYVSLLILAFGLAMTFLSLRFFLRRGR